MPQFGLLIGFKCLQHTPETYHMYSSQCSDEGCKQIRYCLLKFNKFITSRVQHTILKHYHKFRKWTTPTGMLYGVNSLN